MKQLLICIGWLFIFPFMSFSQDIQKGRVMLFDYSENIRPLSNVQIYSYQDTNYVLSDTSGYFLLKQTQNQKHKKFIKHYIRQIHKENYLVFNPKEIDNWNIAQDKPLNIIMCEEELFNSRFKEFYDIGLVCYDKYHKDSLLKYQRQNQNKEISKKQYNQLLSNYYDQFFRYKKSLNALADYFARIDTLTLNPILKECMRLIKEKALLEAIDILEKQNYTKQYIDLVSSETNLQRKQELKQCIDYNINLLKYYSFDDNQDKIEDIYYQLALYNSNDISLSYEYANFLYSNEKYDNAIKWYEQILKKTENRAIVAPIFNQLGTIYLLQHKYTPSEDNYLKSEVIYKDLANEDYYLYTPTIADINLALAILYKQTHNYEQADSLFLNAEKIFYEFSAFDKDRFLPLLANSQIMMASLYDEWAKDSLSIDKYTYAIDLYGELSLLNPKKYKPLLATALNNISLLYQKNNLYIEALEKMGSSSILFEQIIEENSEEHELKLAVIYMNLASLNRKCINRKKSIEIYKKAIDIYETYVAKYPIESLYKISTAQRSMAICFMEDLHFKEAELLLKKAIKIREDLAKTDLDNFLAKEIDLRNDLGYLYEHWGKLDEAKQTYNHSLKLYQELKLNGYYFSEIEQDIKLRLKEINELKSSQSEN